MRFCEICKAEIDPERAELLPDTRLCTEHAKAINKFGGEFIALGTQSSLSKGGSLKKNYGDVVVEQHRNQEAIERLKKDYEHSG